MQETLFVIQAELAGADKHVEQADIDALEQTIEEVEARIEKPSSFLVPGTTVLSALFDLARTVTRRAEREVITARSDKVQCAELTAYLNRLSSFFYAFAREAARSAGQTEPSPTYTRAT